MKHLSAVLLMSEATGKKTQDLAIKAGVKLDAKVVDELDALQSAFTTRQDLLLSFGTNVIVPEWILKKQGLIACNVHAASPQYPGRDPHHFAIYDQAKQYGATLHYMTHNVDAGSIIDVELFDVELRTTTPSGLLNLAKESAWALIKRFFERYIEYGAPKAMSGMSWGTRKTTRKMFLDLCRINQSMPKEEIERRYRATAMPGYKNLFIDIHGFRFRIDELAE